MTLQEVIVSLLQRLGHGRQSDTISFDEVRHWPLQALSMLLKENLIEPTNSAKSIFCTGCPENCFMPVHTLPGKQGNPTRHFIACDETDYMGKIAVRPKQLQQWQISDKKLAVWLAKKLGLRNLTASSKVPGELQIGSILNDKSRCQVVLSSTDVLSLKINQHFLPVVEVLYVEDDHLVIDQVAIDSLARQSLSVTSKFEYQPSTVRREARKLDTQSMYAEWQKVYRQLNRENPSKSDTWIAKKISKMKIAQGRNSETIRKNMKS